MRAAGTPIPALALLALAVTGCPPRPPPGELVVGVFDFATSLVQDGCQLSGQQDPGSFTAVVSVDQKNAQAFLTRATLSHSGILSGDRFAVFAQANRDLPARAPDAGAAAQALGPCGCPGIIVERIEGRLVGELEARARGFNCLSAPGPLDAGTLLLRDGGLDVRMICGTLTDQMAATDPACRCDPCTAAYQLAGLRQ